MRRWVRRTVPSSKRTRRCLPTASTPVTTVPGPGRRARAEARGASSRTRGWPTRAGRSRFGRPVDRVALGHGRSLPGSAVRTGVRLVALTPTTPAHVRSGGRGPCSCRPSRLTRSGGRDLGFLADRDAVDGADLEAAVAAAVEERDAGHVGQSGRSAAAGNVVRAWPPRSRNTTGTPSARTTWAPADRGRPARRVGPAQRRAVGLGRVDGGEHDDRALRRRRPRARCGTSAAGRPHRGGRTGRRRGRRRSSRGGPGPAPRAP